MRLHHIPSPNPLAAICFYVRGANGKSITPVGHVWLELRRTPPPAGQQRPTWANPTFWRTQRQSWAPFANRWDIPNEEALTPLCGRLRTRSRFPNRSNWPNWDQAGICPDCDRLARARGLTPMSIDAANRNDPWTALSLEDRERLPDPISGL